MEPDRSAAPPRHSPWKRWLSGWRAGLLVLICVGATAFFALGWWRAGGASLVALALAAIPCGIACALGLCIMDRSKAKGHCHGGKPSGA